MIIVAEPDQVDADLTAGRLPRLVFVTPSLDHDMHGAGGGGDDEALVATADRWLEGLYGKLAGSSAWRDGTRLVVSRGRAELLRRWKV